MHTCVVAMMSVLTATKDTIYVIMLKVLKAYSRIASSVSTAIFVEGILQPKEAACRD